MSDWKNIAIPPVATMRDAIRAIDAGSLQIALVIDQDEKLIGTLTDGDIRRAILAGCSLDQEIRGVMNTKPLSVGSVNDRSKILSLMKQRKIHQIPRVDEGGRVVGIESIDEMLQPVRHDNWVVLMAGGLGSRLKPLTDDCPKPMLTIGNRPILENILENFIDQGFHRFFISVNYMADKIKSHFGDGSRWGVTIRYLEESQRLGTAGALKLLDESPQSPIFVMNGDVLSKVNFESMLDFHLTNQYVATMGVRQYSQIIPYGVVEIQGSNLVRISEKPEYKFFVNSGIYVLSPEVIDKIPGRQFYDMPTLFQSLMSDSLPTSVFPVHEYWIDIGRQEDLERARTTYQQ